MNAKVKDEKKAETPVTTDAVVVVEREPRLLSGVTVKTRVSAGMQRRRVSDPGGGG